MQHILDELNTMTESRAVIATDVGQHQMWAAQFCKTLKPNDWLTSGGAGTMRFGFPAAIGAVWTPERTGDCHCRRWWISDDDERVGHGLRPAAHQGAGDEQPLLGNGAAVAELFYEDRKSGVDLEGNPDFAKLADCYPGAKGFTLKRPADVRKF
jgi:acetolactate synthase-1/2/3 large subunit